MSLIIAQIVFWLSVIALFYTYIGYPVIVYLLGLMRPHQVRRAGIEPTVTILITAYNEERDIADKLENTLKIDYPKEKLEILVASDGSTDQTDQIVRNFAERGVKLFRQEGRVGKTFTQNKAVEQATGEIIIFPMRPQCIKQMFCARMLPNFADETVGCVAGKLVYVDPIQTSIGRARKVIGIMRLF